MTDKKFMDAVSARDFTVIRDMLRIRLLSDHDVTGGLFNKCWTECKMAGITQDIFQEHDGRDIPNEKSESNYNTLTGQLATNFSEVRLNKIISLAKEIWADEQTGQSTQSLETITNSQKNSESNQKVAGEERVISERILGMREIKIESKESHSSDRHDSFRGSNSRNSQNMHSESEREDSRIGVVVAVAAVAAAAIIAGVVIFG